MNIWWMLLLLSVKLIVTKSQFGFFDIHKNVKVESTNGSDPNGNFFNDLINESDNESKNKCIWPFVQTLAGTCVNILIDRNNCGDIDHKCHPVYKSCSLGLCSMAPVVQLTKSNVFYSVKYSQLQPNKVGSVTLPFNITLYNTTTNVVFPTLYGIISLGYPPGEFYNEYPPKLKVSTAAALPYYAVLSIDGGTPQGIYHQVQNNAPNRTVIFEYNTAVTYEVAQYCHFQVLFFEAKPGIVQFIYLDTPIDGEPGYIGVQDSMAKSFMQYSSREVFPVIPNMSIIFDTNHNTYTTHVICGSKTCTIDETCVENICIKQSSLSFVARWSPRKGQGHIVVRTPMNNTIHVRRPRTNSSLDEGRHEQVDNGSRIDHIYWPSNSIIPKGLYKICFSTGTLLDGTDKSPLTVTVEIRRFRQIIATIHHTFNTSTKTSLDKCIETSDIFIQSYSTESCTWPFVSTSPKTCVNVLTDSKSCGMAGYQCNQTHESCSDGLCQTMTTLKLNNQKSIWQGTLNGSARFKDIAVTLPFNITLYNTTTDHLIMHDNGVICFRNCSGLEIFRSKSALPRSNFIGATIFSAWADLILENRTSDGIYWSVYGNTPHRTIVFDYYIATRTYIKENCQFQVLFFEDKSGIVQFIYRNISDGETAVMVGMQGSSSGPFMLYSVDGFLTALRNLSIIFDTNHNTYTTHVICGSKTCTIDETCVENICIKQSSLSFVARWSPRKGQGHIVVRTPMNNTIHVRRPRTNSSLDEGRHEQVDNGSRIDHIYWSLNNLPTEGLYKICFSTGTLLNGTDKSPLTVTIEIRRFRQIIATIHHTFNTSTKTSLDKCIETSDIFIQSYSTVVCEPVYAVTLSGTCVNTLIDRNNCGRVGHKCHSSYTSCARGVCSMAPAIQLKRPAIILQGAVDGFKADTGRHVALPFNITVYNRTDSSIMVLTSGMICFGDGINIIPKRSIPETHLNNGVFPYYSDMQINEETVEGIYYDIYGSAPNRTIVFEFYETLMKQVDRFCHFQMYFFENKPGIIQFIYLNISDGGKYGAIGVHGSRSLFKQYSYREPFSVVPNMSITFDTNQNTYMASILCGRKSCPINETCVHDICAQQSSLSFVARWTQRKGQGHIIIRTPLNRTIYYAKSRTNSTLDEGQHQQVGNRSEVDYVYWPRNSTVPKGLYSICFNTGSLMNSTDKSSVKVSIEIRQYDVLMKTITRTFNRSTTTSNKCTDTSETFVGFFRIRWSTIKPMKTARQKHAACTLSNGHVLVIGGSNDGGQLNSAELYNPSSGQWTTVGNMTTARCLHTASLLSDGKILVTGGYHGDTSLNTAELYDPSSRSWTAVGSMKESRERHTASVLLDGKVLVTGGFDSYRSSNTAELYDSSARKWTYINSMKARRNAHVAVVLSSGKVLVIGNSDKSDLYVAELYDPSSGQWTAAGNMISNRRDHSASSLPDGKVLVVGGFVSDSPVDTAEIYDPPSNEWAEVGNMSITRGFHTATVLSDGKVLIVGGGNYRYQLDSAELYDPASSTWTPTDSTIHTRSGAVAVKLLNGKLLIIGGSDNKPLDSAELYDP